MSDLESRGVRLRKARLAAGFQSAADAARYLGVKYPTYAGHENSGVNSADVLGRYARKFKVPLDWLLTGSGTMLGEGIIPAEVVVMGLPIEGAIQAGHWLETTFIDALGDDPEMLPVARDPRFPRARQYAMRVVGDSMDMDYPDGSYVTCVDFAESGLAIKEGMTVHVERLRGGGQLVEITLKQVAREDGSFVLHPRSSNKVHQPIRLSASGPDTEVRVRGIVTGGWRQTPIP